MEPEKFFLKANDEEGCDIISSLLQDSIMHITSHSFHEDKRCLRLMLNRFCWELLKPEDFELSSADPFIGRKSGMSEARKNAAASSNENSAQLEENCYYRVHSGLYIHNVQDVRINNNFKNIAQERYVNLLAMHANGNEINLLFSGHKHVYVTVDSLNVYLKDLHDRYPTPTRSVHNL